MFGCTLILTILQNDKHINMKHNLCNQEYVFKSTTMNMSNHLKRERTSNSIMLPGWQMHKGGTILQPLSL